MYLIKDKKSAALYGYAPKLSKHQNTELEGHIAQVVGNDISNRVSATVRGISGMIVKGIMQGGN